MAGLIHVGANDAHELMGDLLPDYGGGLEVHEPRDCLGPMVLIEPQPLAFARLAENFAGREDVTCINVACGAAPGMAEMHVANQDVSSSLLAPKIHLEILPHVTFGGTITVPVDTLDHVLIDIPGVYDRLLLDCQGYELEVLQGATETLRRVVWLKTEVSIGHVYDGQALMGDLDEFLADHGFRRTRTDLYGEVWGDAIYTREMTA